MASNVYIQQTADGRHLMRRSIRQGRKPAGLGKAYLQRLDAETERKLEEIHVRLGPLYNKSEIVRIAAAQAVDLIYTELFKH